MPVPVGGTRWLFSPYEVVTVDRGGEYRAYEVCGSHAGAVSEESVVTLRPWSKTHRDLPDHDAEGLLIVPEFMLHSMLSSGRAWVKAPPAAHDPLAPEQA